MDAETRQETNGEVGGTGGAVRGRAPKLCEMTRVNPLWSQELKPCQSLKDSCSSTRSVKTRKIREQHENGSRCGMLADRKILLLWSFL